MSFEAALKDHLQVQALADLVGDRITPMIREETKTTPAITYQVITFDQVPHLSGRDNSLRHVRVQLDLWAKKHSDILSIDAAVRSRMDTAASSFRSAMLPSGIDDFEPDTKLYRRTLEYSCWYTES